MVQAINEDFDDDQEDVSQALALLREMNTNVQNVAQVVDNMIVKVHKGELSTTQGLSFLEMKYHMLLSYLINVTYAILRKCSGETIEGDPSIDRLVEIRTVLEKIRPIDHRLKYQIDKLVKAAVQGTVEENDPSMLRANPDNLLGNDDASSEGSDDDEEVGTKEKKSKSGIYVPPKLAAVHYDGDESIVEKNKRLQENKRKHSLHSSVIEDLRDEYLDTPQEVSHGNYAQKTLSRFEQEKTEYEENYLTRLPETKVERNRRKQFHSMGSLADEIVYGHSSSNGKSSSKRKRQSNKIKKKSGGKKRRTQ